jgi:hypothetical protein
MPPPLPQMAPASPRVAAVAQFTQWLGVGVPLMVGTEPGRSATAMGRGDIFPAEPFGAAKK